MSQRLSIDISDELYASIVAELKLPADASKATVQREFASSLYEAHRLERPLSKREVAALEAKKAKLAELKAELEAAGIDIE